MALYLTKELLEDAYASDFIIKKILKAMGDKDTAVISFTNRKDSYHE